MVKRAKQLEPEQLELGLQIEPRWNLYRTCRHCGRLVCTQVKTPQTKRECEELRRAIGEREFVAYLQ
jgi:hypothetical protein